MKNQINKTGENVLVNTLKTNDQKILNLILRKDFKSFVIKAFQTVAPNADYLDNWHIDVICDAILKCENNTNLENRLIINIPPRNLKSIVCNIAWTAWLLGQNPKASIISVSYNDELSKKFALDTKKVIESNWYQEVFPKTKISKNKKSTHDFETTLGGGRYSTSVCGTLTGRGADYIILDDVIKPNDASSDLQREKVNNWFLNTLFSRLNDKETGKIILVMQRLHLNDLSGFLLEKDLSFKQLKLPLIATENEEWSWTDPVSNKKQYFIRKEGEVLHPERESKEKALELKGNIGAYNFSAQYQQNPIPKEGNLVKKDWIKYYKPSKLPRMKKLFLSWDTASKTGKNNAYTVCLVFGVGTNNIYYLLECFRNKKEISEVIEDIRTTPFVVQKKYGGVKNIVSLIEDNSAGALAIQMFNKPGSLNNILSITPKGSKEERLEAVTYHLKKGTCLFPDNNPFWWNDFYSEIISFPSSKFKDQCDALSQFLNIITDEKAKQISSYAPKTLSVRPKFINGIMQTKGKRRAPSMRTV